MWRVKIYKIENRQKKNRSNKIEKQVNKINKNR